MQAMHLDLVPTMLALASVVRFSLSTNRLILSVAYLAMMIGSIALAERAQ